MKEITFSFISALIFMMGSLNLIQTEPYSKLNFWKPLLNKPRKLEGGTNYIAMVYEKTIGLSWKGGNVEKIVVNGTHVVGNIRIPAGAK